MPRTQINEELLITEVQKHPCLYDIDSRHYKDAEMANNAWTAISQTCESTVAECKSRWKSLRDRYVRMKRELKTKSGQGAKSKRPWKYAGIMSFLARFIQEAETCSNLVLSDDDADDQQQGDRLLDATDTNTDVTMDVSTDSQSNTTPSNTFTSRSIVSKELSKPTKRSRNQADDPVGRAMLNYLQKEDAVSNEKQDADEDELFLRSQVPALKRLPPRKKAEVKFLIHELLYKAECFPDMQLNVQTTQIGFQNQTYAPLRMNSMNQDWDFTDSTQRYQNL